MRRLLLLTSIAVLGITADAGFAQVRDPGFWITHPPMRWPLSFAMDRPIGKGPAYFVDPAKGNDQHDGSEPKPWKTINHALKRLKPGDTVYLREGSYFEQVTASLAGTAEKPITIRSYPKERVVLDGGFREFFEEPAKAWEPFAGGAKGEYRSTKTYADVGHLSGNFADSMVPLHSYRYLVDFRTDNPYWNIGKNDSTDKGIYCGPGLWYNAESKRIHIRLAHTALKVLGDDNYRGVTDLCKLPLVVAGKGTALHIDKSRHLRLQGLIVRGSAGRTVQILGAEDIEFDNVAIYGGSPALFVESTKNLRLFHSALRGLTAPWSSRASHKYRGLSPYLLIVSGKQPQCQDFEFAHCEFTDNHDGLIIGTLKGLKFHHNLVENFDDDGLYLTLSRDKPPEGIHIYQNVLARCLTTFAFAESGKGVKNDVGPGVYIYRNLIDLRRATPSTPPASAEEDKPGAVSWHREGRPVGDHGGPVWEPMFVYHNTVITPSPAFRNFYGGGWGGHNTGSKRRVFNNIFVQVEGNPGLAFGPPDDNLHVDGNLLWGAKEGRAVKGDFFEPFRKSKLFEASKKQYPPGWGANDRFGEPKFVGFDADWRQRIDPRLQPGSPAIDAGVELPADWPDPLRKLDKGRPDMGVFPLGVEPLQVGRPPPKLPEETAKPRPQEQTGRVLGTVRFTGQVPPPKKLETTENNVIVHHDLIVDPKSKGLRDVVAVLENAPAQPAVKKGKPILMDQREMIFLPRVLAVQQGQTVRFENNDQCNHSVIANSLVRANQFNLFVTHQHPYEHAFEAQKHPITIGCSLHAWMRAYVYVFPHPWFALSDTQGQFRIEGIPAGTYTLWVRHPDTGKQERRELIIRAGESTKVAIEWDRVEDK